MVASGIWKKCSFPGDVSGEGRKAAGATTNTEFGAIFLG